MQLCAVAPFSPDAASSCDTRWRPHDLLRLQRWPFSSSSFLSPDGSEPAWVRDAFDRAPYVVVRRAAAAEGFVAIGLRGEQRSQRYGAWARASDIDAVIAPEALATRLPDDDARRALPAFAALAALQRDTAAAIHTFVWGPTGSVGFELAARVPVVSESSDLDVLIRAPSALSTETAVQMLEELQVHAQSAGIRVDAQLETPAGGIALAEWAAGKSRVMARHAPGPHLVEDPWAARVGA